MTKSNVLFTHDDLDGAGCRILYNLAFLINEFNSDDPDMAVFNCSNNGIDRVVLSKIEDGTIGYHTDVYFADIAPKWETILKLYEVENGNIGDVKVFDHHLTNEYLNDQMVGSYVSSVDENKKMKCGTSILHEKFSVFGYVPTQLEQVYRSIYDNSTALIDLFVDTIRSYDTYEWKSTNNMIAKQFMTLFTLMGMDAFCKYYYELLRGSTRSNKKSMPLISDEHMVFVNARLDQEEKIIESITPNDVSTVDVRGYKTALFTKSVFANISELAYKFLTKYPDYDIFIAASLAAGGKFEIRTVRDDLDTGKDIALPIGGGGHPKASGAPISVNIMNTFISNLINQLRGDLI